MSRLIIDIPWQIKECLNNENEWTALLLAELKNIVNNGIPLEQEPTVKAIPKADYEAKLKADMVAMLEQLDSELQEQIAFSGDGEEANGMKEADNLIKDKINDLKQSIWQDNYNGKK